MVKQDLLISWLNDAFVMERSMVHILENHLKDLAEDHVMNEKLPQMREKLHEHIHKTKQHSQLVQSCIERLGGDISALGESAVSTIAVLETAPANLAKDVVIKNALTGYAAEQKEIAAYIALISAAEELGDQETMNVCSKILSEEEEMEAWLSEQLPTVVQEFLRSQE